MFSSLPSDLIDHIYNFVNAFAVIEYRLRYWVKQWVVKHRQVKQEQKQKRANNDMKFLSMYVKRYPHMREYVIHQLKTPTTPTTRTSRGL
jgi:hypothetical protein